MVKMTGSHVVVEYQLLSRFDEVRARLLCDPRSDHLNKPLAHWALPGDRRLPIAFMGRPLRDLLETPFLDLFATPGIGQKKISSLVNLLHRAAEPQPPGALPAMPTTTPVANDDSGAAVDPTVVSEALWVQWRESVVRHDLGGESLGRFAVSLQNLPRVIWRTPLSAYVDLSLADMRSLKTHGQKRVNAVLEVFGLVHSIVAHASGSRHLSVRIEPRVVTQVQSWANGQLEHFGGPLEADLLENFVKPLIEQVRLDAGEQVAMLAENRLGLSGACVSVRQTARQMGLTRARVYQLLNEAGVVVNVRWPDGPAIIARLREHYRGKPGEVAAERMFVAACDLLFPKAPLEATEENEDAAPKLVEHANRTSNPNVWRTPSSPSKDGFGSNGSVHDQGRQRSACRVGV